MTYNHHSSQVPRFCRAIASFALCAAGICLNFHALATDFEIVRVVSSSDIAPGTGGNYGTIADYDLDGNNLVFRSQLARSLYLSTPAGITQVVSATTTLPGSPGATDPIHPSISGTEFAFSKLDSTGSRSASLYVTRGGNISLLANTSTPVPNGTGNFAKFWFGSLDSADGNSVGVSVNSALSNGTAVFHGTNGNNQSGIYYAGVDGALHRAVDQTTAVKALGGASIDGNNIAFIGLEGGQYGIYRYSVSNQALTPVVAPGTLPMGQQFYFIHAPSISGENVAFVAGPNELSGSAIYTANSTGLQLVAQNGMQAPGVNGAFTGDLGLFGVTISGTAVAFLADTTAATSGVYTNVGGQLSKVVDTNTLLEGNVITSFRGTPKVSGSNVAFATNRGLYVAMSEHHWAGTGSGSWGTNSNWSFGLSPRGLIPTFVDPANGAVITGPTTNVSLKSLTIGATQSGIAELQLQASGQISVNGAVTITPLGRLNVAGVLSATGAVTNSGVIVGSGQVAGQLINAASGEVRVNAGSALRFTGALNANAGTIDVTSGEVEFTQGLVNQPSTGIISARDATLRFGAGLTNPGALALVSGTSDVFGDIVNTGSITITGGTAPSTYTAIFHDDVLQNGTLTVSASGGTRSAAVFLGSFGGSGGITGGGDVFFEGDLRPGNSPASVTMGTSVFFGPQAHIAMELGGALPGTQYDHLVFLGSIGLNGTLDVTLINGFNPQAGSSFDLFDFNPAIKTGSFGAVNLPGLQPGLSWDTSALQTLGTIAVIPEPSASVLVTVGFLSLIGRSRRRRFPVFQVN